MHARMEQSAQLLTPTLSRPKLTTNADELPEAVVLEDEGAAMAGFVGLLRQLGDLAQLAAEVFDGLHEQATAVSARARGLTLGTRRLEAELTLVEERLRRRRSARPCFVQQQDVAVACSNSVFSSGIRSEGLCRVAGHGVHRRRASARPVNHGVIVVGGTKPRSIAEHIRRCRGPPQLSMLDKYDAGGEGACLKRYTDPSFFRAQSAKHELFLQETKPKLQSSHKCSKFKTDALLDMLRQLKYRHIIGRIRRQMHSSHNQDSPEDEASEAHVLSPSDSPETSNTKVPCPSVPVNKERSSDLVERTSSFRAWLSPDAASTHASDIIQETNADGFASHGANKADDNANIATNARSALINFIASRVESSPRKLSVRKHSDPLTESFRNMAKKVLLENESAHSSQRTSEF
ncbi:hypothetical protein VPH35_018957 [Triticum aestivum]|uniref:Protein SCAR n=1 Tax=Triticum aestivum TaxID=4565 RepID=A0A3B6ASP8_WHEAT|nr:scar-like domain-containing protein WAVE 5 [Triticum aestivum]